MNINRFISIARMTQEQLFISLYEFLLEKYGSVQKSSSNEYMFVQGTSSVCLVAHLDTVFQHPPTRFFRARFNKNILLSPYGLGADDRAGVYAIMTMIDAGLRPSVIFTTDEEIGGIGAWALVKNHKKCPIKASCLIELDRGGKDDSVYYNCGNQEFMEYINSFGFYTAEGSFSDISYFAPEWNLAAVNLSVGYKNEHTYQEKLNCKHLDLTISKVSDIILSEPKYYDYQEDVDFTFYKRCFACTTGACDNCDYLLENSYKGGEQWRQKVLS